MRFLRIALFGVIPVAILLVTLYALPLSRRYSFELLGETFTQVNYGDIVPILQILEKRWQEEPLIIQVGEKRFRVEKRALGLRWDYSSMRKSIMRNLVPLSLSLSWDEERVQKCLESLARQTTSPPQDAVLREKRFVRAQRGKILDTTLSLPELKERLEKGESEVTLTHFTLLPPKKDTATLLEEHGFPYLLARYTTSLKDRDADVIFNIAKAAQTLDGLAIEKGVPFSFNQIVGKADAQDGYRKTQIVVNGRLVPGYGGGVCQVSTTLYNALLRTEAKVLERHPHSGYSFTTSYVPPGSDAAVSHGVKDLRFVYPSQSVVLFAYIEEENLICEIWGERENTLETTVETRLLEMKKQGEKEGFFTVETTVAQNGEARYRFTDTYLAPWEIIEELQKKTSAPQ